MQKPESVLENETHKILWDFVIQMIYQIEARRPDLVIMNKKKVDHCGSGKKAGQNP